mmetsp:Transcript_34394/g.79390  ORF Transcript_34394/g.79390 Transcript_34394/m.79390 type:complete len:247 (+) Transcript_34394:983-1723(+)
MDLFGTVLEEIGWQETNLLVVVVLFSIHVELHSKGTSGWFKMKIKVGIRISLEWIRSSVKDGMTFVEDHVSWFLGTDLNRIVMAISPIEFQWPRFSILVVCHVNHGRNDQWQTIDVRSHHGAFCIFTNPVHARWSQLHSRPFFYNGLNGFPEKFLFRWRVVVMVATKLFLLVWLLLLRAIVVRHEVRIGFPMIGIDIGNVPLFQYLGIIHSLLLLPLLCQESCHVLGSTHLRKACRCVIHHGSGLS